MKTILRKCNYCGVEFTATIPRAGKVTDFCEDHRTWASRNKKKAHAIVTAWVDRQPNKLAAQNARVKIAYAIKMGYLVRPTHCPKCGKEAKLVAHHYKGYDYPYTIEWLCRSCHRKTQVFKNKLGRKPFLKDKIKVRNPGEDSV